MASLHSRAGFHIYQVCRTGIGLVAKMVIHNSRARVLKDIPVYTGAKFSFAPNYKLSFKAHVHRHTASTTTVSNEFLQHICDTLLGTTRFSSCVYSSHNFPLCLKSQPNKWQRYSIVQLHLASSIYSFDLRDPFFRCVGFYGTTILAYNSTTLFAFLTVTEAGNGNAGTFTYVVQKGRQSG